MLYTVYMCRRSHSCDCKAEVVGRLVCLHVQKLGSADTAAAFKVLEGKLPPLVYSMAMPVVQQLIDCLHRDTIRIWAVLVKEEQAHAVHKCTDLAS